jgi:hypothetical protein
VTESGGAVGRLLLADATGSRHGASRSGCSGSPLAGEALLPQLGEGSPQLVAIQVTGGKVVLDDPPLPFHTPSELEGLLERCGVFEVT